jgi:hypothetical protein
LLHDDDDDDDDVFEKALLCNGPIGFQFSQDADFGLANL